MRCAVVAFVVGAAVTAGATNADAASRWSIMSAPDPSAVNELLAVSCTSDTFCVAVGFQEGPTGSDFATLIETFDGANWSVVASPNPGGRSALTSVSCT